MRILGRYLFREVALHFVAITGLLFAIYSSFLFAKVLFKAASNQFAQNFVWSLLGLSALQNLKELVPVGLFLAILLALGRLYHDSEIAAMQACSFGMRRWCRPVLSVTGAVVVLLSGLVFWIAPQAMTRSQEILLQAARQARFASLEPQRFRPFAGGVVFYAESVDAQGVLHNVFVQRQAGDKVEVTVADRAEQLGAGEAQQTFVLYDGASYQGIPGEGAFRKTTFDESRIPVRLPNLQAGAARVDSKPTTTLLTSNTLADRAELQARISIPLMTLILAIMAVPLSRLRPRQSRYANVGLGLLVFFAYLLAIRTASTWVEQQTIPADAGVWWVHLIALLAALYLLFRQDPPAWLIDRRARVEPPGAR